MLIKINRLVRMELCFFVLWHFSLHVYACETEKRKLLETAEKISSITCVPFETRPDSEDDHFSEFSLELFRHECLGETLVSIHQMPCDIYRLDTDSEFELGFTCTKKNIVDGENISTINVVSISRTTGTYERLRAIGSNGDFSKSIFRSARGTCKALKPKF